MARKGRSVESGKVSDGVYEYELQSGKTITYKPINPDLRQAIWEEYEDPEPPMREVKTVDGGVERLPDTDAPSYQEALETIRRQRAVALIRLLVIQSLEDVEPPADWIERQRWIMPGWEPPAEPLEQKAYWVQHWLLSPFDLAGLLQAAQLAAALTPEEVERQLRSFRSQMARAVSAELGDTIEQNLAQFRVGDDSGGGLGEDTMADVS